MWYNSAVEDANHIRNSYVGVNNDKKLAKEETDLLVNFNTQVQTSVELLRELNKIDPTKTPVKYAEAQKKLNASISETRRLFKEIDAHKLTGTDQYKNTIESARSTYSLGQEVDNNQEQKDLENQQKKDIARYKTLLKEKYSLQDKITGANKNTDTTAWQQMLSDAETELQTLRAGFKNFSVTDELDLIEKSYQATANNKANNTKDKEEADYVKDIVSDYSALIKLQNKRPSLFKPEDVDRLNDVDDAITRISTHIKKSKTDAANAGFNLAGNQDIEDQEAELLRAKKISDREFTKNLTNYNDAQTAKTNLSTMQKLNTEYDKNIKLRKELSEIDQTRSPVAYGHKQNDIQNSNTEIKRLKNEAKNAGLDTTEATNEFLKKSANLRESITNRANDEADAEVIKKLVSLYAQYDKAVSNRAKLVKDEDIDDLKEVDNQINKLTEDIIKLEDAAQASGINLQDNAAYVSAFNNSIANEARANKEFSSKRTKYVDIQNDALMKEYEQWISRMQRAGTQKEQANKSNLPWKESSFNKQYEEAEAELNRIDEELQNRGLELNQEYLALLNKRATAERVVAEAQEKRIESQRESIEVTQNEVNSIDSVIGTLNNLQNRLRNAGGTSTDTYSNVIRLRDSAQNLREALSNSVGLSDSDKNKIALDWASNNNLSGLKDYKEVLSAINALLQRYREQTEKISSNKSFNVSITKQKTELANLKSELNDYLKKSPGVESGLSDKVMTLRQALNDTNAYKNIGQLKQSFAELRAQAKEMGLETENLIDKFKNLFGQHFNTMITMGALHQMQNALRVIYQNVVEIDTALTELKKVSELTGKSLESYMDRAAESAQKLGVSISDYISSTADWKRLGYSDEDAENMATYSTLLKNVGDGIDDVNTSSSYLISTLQGFGLLAKDAEDVVDKIDAVANTQPVTAEAIGEILTRSSAAMSAANNTLDETISLGTAAYAVLQNAESTGTTLKTLSMYLRAAKTDAEDAGIEVDGMANSVSELRSELKSLTGVDIMIDSKNFKSTYQIMKELSEVWGSLSDVTKANVTEMIGGKRNANAVSAILSNFSVAESSMESAANSANVA